MCETDEILIFSGHVRQKTNSCHGSSIANPVAAAAATTTTATASPRCSSGRQVRCRRPDRQRGREGRGSEPDRADAGHKVCVVDCALNEDQNVLRVIISEIREILYRVFHNPGTGSGTAAAHRPAPASVVRQRVQLPPSTTLTKTSTPPKQLKERN